MAMLTLRAWNSSQLVERRQLSMVTTVTASRANTDSGTDRQGRGGLARLPVDHVQ